MLMALTPEEQNIDQPTDSFPLLVESRGNHENQHVIDLERGGDDDTSSNASNDSLQVLARTPLASTSQLVRDSSSGSHALSMRGDGLGRRRWSPFDTLLWISIELVFTLGQIIASVVVLYVSRNENPQTPLFAWIVGYAAGCFASLPFLFWRYLHRNQATELASNRDQQPPSDGNHPPEPNSYITISFARSSEEETRPAATSPNMWNNLNLVSSARLAMLVDHFKMALDCFFAVWFVVGNVWIFGGHSSSTDAPNLYRLCIVFLTFSCIGYAMPFILCGMICCCLPCIISILGVHEDMNQVKGASEESINALPTHKFKVKKGNSDTKDNDSGVDEGGVLATGTDKERAISGEDAVCCICLAKYADNDLLRELPCSHFFHIECVDKWLKINASCPLCKFEIGSSSEISSTGDSNQQQA
uniref:E3 ubiquitin-protein ligase At1g63170-like n=1 Tax=Erigeron canadensis TaxID=72917 RepID=UPI001CB91279|nr:E3 ubiquitin-protein ligase At1g63170-like [Erigeron canadensis]